MAEPEIKLAKHIIIVLFFLAFCVGPCPALGQEKGADAAPLKVLRFASVFDVMPGVDIEDVRLTLKIILRKAAVSKPDFNNAEMDFFSDFDKASDKITNGGYHFVVLTGMDFFEFNPTIPLTPLMILSKLDQPAEPLVLVTRKGISLAQINRKAGATLMLDEGRVGVMARIWMDTLLLESGFDTSRSFFSEIRRSPKSSRILLPVFFGKADACIIPKSTFDLMVELNPQIAETLAIQQQSEELIFWMVCATALATPEDRRIFVDRRNWLINDPDVQQTITLIQMKRFFLFKDSYFKGTTDLFERYERLTNKKHNNDREAAQ